MGIHNAGMLRADRLLTEKLFAEGYLKVLFCTATLAWGVNLPAHTVIIKGTEVYNGNKGTFEDIGMLDVMQIFGRAGRPQFDTSGEGIIITSFKMLPRYLSLLNHALPIESQLSQDLADHLNAEIVLGTITNVREAIQWLSYTYMFIRMIKNPLMYGIKGDTVIDDPSFGGIRREMIEKAGKLLDNSKMIRFNEDSRTFSPTDIGRIASHFYISHETINIFNEKLKKTNTEKQILDIICEAAEFKNLKLRDDEGEELDQLQDFCRVPLPDGAATTQEGKVNILIQNYISNSRVKSFSLISDMNYISSNIGRVTRALFEIVIRNGWHATTDKLLMLSKCIERRMWANDHPLRQFFPEIPLSIIEKMEAKDLDLEKLEDMQADEIDSLLNFRGSGKTILNYFGKFPHLQITSKVQPITKSVLRVHLSLI
jgi:activating signal cointegrator complex subunit 3